MLEALYTDLHVTEHLGESLLYANDFKSLHHTDDAKAWAMRHGSPALCTTAFHLLSFYPALAGLLLCNSFLDESIRWLTTPHVSLYSPLFLMRTWKDSHKMLNAMAAFEP